MLCRHVVRGRVGRVVQGRVVIEGRVIDRRRHGVSLVRATVYVPLYLDSSMPHPDDPPLRSTV